jgi:hypothetical protein
VGLISQTDFAKLVGVTKHAVGEAIKSGRLVKSVRPDEFGTMKIADVELAKREWMANTDTSMVRRPENVDAALARSAGKWEDISAPVDEGDDDGPPEMEADPSTAEMSPAQRKAHWEAKSKELAFRKEAGELVPAAEVERALTDTFTTCKTRLLAIPSRAKQEAPDLTLAHLALLERLIREACSDLAVSA